MSPRRRAWIGPGPGPARPSSARGGGGGGGSFAPSAWYTFDTLDSVSSPDRTNTTLFTPRSQTPAATHDDNTSSRALGWNYTINPSVTTGSPNDIRMEHSAATSLGFTYKNKKFNQGGDDLNFDLATGFKVMGVAGSYDDNASANRANQAHAGIVCVADGFDGNGIPNTYVALRFDGNAATDYNPDRLYTLTREEGGALVYSSAINLSSNIASMNTYLALGLVIPVGGVGNIGYYSRILGLTTDNTPNTGDSDLAFPASFRSKVWDGFYAHVRSGVTLPGEARFHGWWYGDINESWPTFPTS